MSGAFKLSKDGVRQYDWSTKQVGYTSEDPFNLHLFSMAEGEEKNGIIDSIPLFAKELIAGGVTGGIAKTVVASLERIKILFQ